MRRKTKVIGNRKVGGNGKVVSNCLSSIPDPEVLEKPRRRRFTGEYKLSILNEAESLTEPGALGALLRREGLYSSHIAMWTWQREKGELKGLEPQKRGPKEKDPKELENKIKKLERENRRLKKHLERAELIIDVQKKISELSGIPLKEVEMGEED